MGVDTTRVSIKFDPEYVQLETMELVARLQSTVPDSNAVDGFLTISITPGVDIDAFLDTLNHTAGILAAEPYYYIDDSLAAPVGDKFVVGFNSSLSHDSIRAIAIAYGADTVGELDYMPNVYLLRNTTPQSHRLLDLANTFHGIAGVRYSLPDFGLRPVRAAYKLFDHYNSNQWHIKKVIGAFNSSSVWDFAKVKDTVIVAVIDDGITTHEDLPQVRILTGRNYSDTGGYDNNTAPGTGQAHGMGCAGIIAASHTTDSVSGLSANTGVISLSPAVKILPVKIFKDDGSGTKVLSQIAKAISYAWRNGAEVISCSWGFPLLTDPNAVPVISSAIDSAATYGRSGKGCPVIFSAGNSGGAVTFPANRPLCMAVAALQSNDTRWSYSSYGSALGISAPSGNVNLTGDVWTLDQMGSLGYNPSYTGITWDCGSPSDPDYDCHFGGTSAACPVVAGVAALLISKDRSMTRAQIYKCLDSSAVKLGATQPNNDYGWGRVDAFRGVLSLSHGDVNNSGTITLSDLSGLVSYLEGSGYVPFPSVLLGDWNCSGTVDLTDLSCIVAYLTGESTVGPTKPCFKY